MTPAERQMQTEPGVWLSPYKAAKCWDVSTRTIYVWIQQKKVATLLKPSGRMVVWVPEALAVQGVKAQAVHQRLASQAHA